MTTSGWREGKRRGWTMHRDRPILDGTKCFKAVQGDLSVSKHAYPNILIYNYNCVFIYSFMRRVIVSGHGARVEVTEQLRETALSCSRVGP